jgi:hypothetical protein
MSLHSTNYLQNIIVNTQLQSTGPRLDEQRKINKKSRSTELYLNEAYDSEVSFCLIVNRPFLLVSFIVTGFVAIFICVENRIYKIDICFMDYFLVKFWAFKQFFRKSLIKSFEDYFVKHDIGCTFSIGCKSVCFNCIKIKLSLFSNTSN